MFTTAKKSKLFRILAVFLLCATCFLSLISLSGCSKSHRWEKDFTVETTFAGNATHFKITNTAGEWSKGTIEFFEIKYITFRVTTTKNKTFTYKYDNEFMLAPDASRTVIVRYTMLREMMEEKGLQGDVKQVKLSQIKRTTIDTD